MAIVVVVIFPIAPLVPMRPMRALALRRAHRAIRARRERNQGRPRQSLGQELKGGWSSRFYDLRHPTRFTFHALKQSAATPPYQLSCIRAFIGSTRIVDALQRAVLIENQYPIVKRIEGYFPFKLCA